ncbi:class IIb bacteriocin, lactobin A/cerein 7B family [Pseudoduganella chitinolytica]|uniref:class IIb bacteriocin, lactobin A/cerein 7B family n=1 Tax=Pseudoduganella chitinolytica TaxID=34070 RepID=UPI003530F5E2
MSSHQMYVYWYTNTVDGGAWYVKRGGRALARNEQFSFVAGLGNIMRNPIARDIISITKLTLPAAASQSKVRQAPNLVPAHDPTSRIQICNMNCKISTPYRSIRQILQTRQLAANWEITMQAADVLAFENLRTLSMEEIDDISGGVIPLAVAALYAAGFTSGVAAGWTFMSFAYGTRHCSV